MIYYQRIRAAVARRGPVKRTGPNKERIGDESLNWRDS